MSMLSAQNTAKESSRDYVVLKRGKTVVGEIVHMDDSIGLQLKTELGGDIFVPYKDIRRAFRKPTFTNLKDSSYAEIGITFGLPGGINFVAGYWFKNAGIRLSGMYYDENAMGFQLHAGLKLFDNNRERHSVGVSYGKVGDFTNAENNINYLGLTYSYTGPPLKLAKKHHIWFVELGYGKYFSNATSEGLDDSVFAPIMQIGYVHRFIKHAARVEVIPIPKMPKPKRPRRPRIIRKREVIRKKVVKNVIRKGRPCPEPKPCPKCMEAPIVDSLQIYKHFLSKKKKQADSKKTYILVRDNGFPDGDVISIKWNGQLVLEYYELTKEPQKVPVEYLENQNNQLSVTAHNMGKSFPSTPYIVFINEIKDQKKIFNLEFEKPEVKEILVK